MNKVKIPSVQERRLALEEQYPVWPRVILARHFEIACEKYGDRPFIYVDENKASFGEAWHCAEKYAAAMLALGVQRRDHVAVLMENDPDFVSLLIGVSMIGAVFIPLNTMFQEEELGYILQQSDTRFLFMHRQVKKISYDTMIAGFLENAEWNLNNSLEKIICFEDGGDLADPKFMSRQQFTDLAGKTPKDELKQRYNDSQYPDEIAMIMYTSGSTGKAKGVMLTHDMLLRSAYATCLSRAIEDGRVTYAPMPFYHCYNMVEGILAMSFVGGLLIAPPLFTPYSALQIMEKYRVNDFLCVPSMFVPLIAQPDIGNYDLSHLYAVWVGAAPAPSTIWQEGTDLLGLKEICTGYGQTEVSSSGVITEMRDPIERIASRVGRPKLAGSAGLPEYGGSVVEYATLDTETMRILPKGKMGELVVRGNTVTRGYYKKPEETAELINPDGWLRTGDLGRIDDNGYIEMMGRSKEVYKVSGELVAPKEVEDVINRHEAVAQSWVVGIPSAITTETGVAFVELREGKSVSAQEIIELCSDKLARFKVPRHVWFVQESELPKTATGKVQKMKLKDMAEEKLKR